MGFFNGLPLESEALFVSRLCVQLVIILILPRILHFTILEHLLQPRVISEIVSGIILGPSCLGQIGDFTALFFPARATPYLASLSQVGVILFLFMTGLHLNAEIIWEYKYFAVVASFTAIGLTFAIAPGLSLAFEGSQYSSFNHTELILLMAILLSIPAEAVMARILAERGLLRSKLGSFCMATDTVGLLVCFILLAALLSIHGAEHPYHQPPGGCPGNLNNLCIPPNDAEDLMDPLWILLVFIAFCIALLTVGRFLASFLTERTAKKGHMEGVIFVASMIMCFSAAWLTQTLTVSSLLGPVLLGLLSFPRVGTLCQNLQTALQPITVGILLPVFFAQVGLKTDFRLLTSHDVMLSFLLLGALWCTTFVGAIVVSFLWNGAGYKNIYFATLLTCKGLTALTVFNILFSVGVITTRFYALIVLYALISCAIVSPIVWFFQRIREHRKKGTVSKVSSETTTNAILVLPRTGYLAPVAATVAGWIANSMELPGLTVFTRIVDDIENIDAYIPVLQDPIPASILTTDSIFGPAQVQWNSIRPQSEVIYKAVATCDVMDGFLKLASASKLANHRPFPIQILGYDHTNASQRIIMAALRLPNVKIIVVTGQPAISLSGARSALAVLDGVSDRHIVRDLYAKSSKAPLAYWRLNEQQDRPPEVQNTESILDLLLQISKIPNPSFDAVFCPIPSSSGELIAQLKCAHNCKIPVIFEGTQLRSSASNLLPIVEVRIDADENDHSDHDPDSST